jgi:IS30 family transposase
MSRLTVAEIAKIEAEAKAGRAYKLIAADLGRRVSIGTVSRIARRAGVLRKPLLTQEQKDLIKAEALAGRSYTAIAGEMKLNLANISRLGCLAGLSRAPRLTSQQKERITRMARHAPSFSKRALAAELGCDKNTVVRHFRRARRG